MKLTELKRLSLEFRRMSSNFLNSTRDTADINLSRFVAFISSNSIIKHILDKKVEGVVVDFNVCFDLNADNLAKLKIPEDESKEIKAEIDYLNYINGHHNLLGEAMRFPWPSNKYNDIIQHFIDKCFKPLIDYINDQLSMELIIAEDVEKTSGGNTFIQNIENLNGTANQQGQGILNVNPTVNCTETLIPLIDKLLDSLAKIENIDEEQIESVKDDLEVVQEQLKSEAPKKRRLEKALTGIKDFASKFTLELSVALATGAVTSVDWNSLIAQAETYIASLV